MELNIFLSSCKSQLQVELLRKHCMENFLGGVRKGIQRCQGCVLKMSGRFLKAVWKVSERCQEGVKKVTGGCVKGVGRVHKGVWKVC